MTKMDLINLSVRKNGGNILPEYIKDEEQIINNLLIHQSLIYTEKKNINKQKEKPPKGPEIVDLEQLEKIEKLKKMNE